MIFFHKKEQNCHKVGNRLVLKANVERFSAERAWSKGLGNALKVFFSACQADLGSNRMDTLCRTDFVMSTSLALVSNISPMLRVSLLREPGVGALVMPWRSSLAFIKQTLSLRGWILLGKLT